MTAPFRPEFGGRYLSGEEAQALGAAGFGGRSVPSWDGVALLVIDVTWGFCGKPSHATLREAVQDYPHACGPAAWAAIPNIRALVEGARKRGAPVVFTRPTPPHGRPSWHGRLEEKNTRRGTAPPDAFEIVPSAGYRLGDPVLDKDGPSAFFGTPLVRWLRGLRVSGVVVFGVSTSGCVRATAVDAFSYDLPTTIVADASFDRVNASHDVTLLDFQLKYGDVASTRDLLRAWGRRASRAEPPGSG